MKTPNRIAPTPPTTMWKHPAVAAIFVLGLLLGVGTLTLRAEELPTKGILKGYYVVSRWNEKMFVRGTSTYFVSDDAAKTLAPLAGKPVSIDALRIVQEMNPGAGMIMEVGKVEVQTPAPNLTLTVKQKMAKVVPTPPGVTLEVTLENRGAHAVRVIPRNLQIVLATNKPVEPKNWKDAENRAYWYHSEAMMNGKDVLRFAYHVAPSEWTAQQMIAAGKDITLASEKGDNNPIVLFGLAATFSGEITLGKELPPGTYEAFAFIADGDLPAMSSRISIDVAEPAKE